MANRLAREVAEASRATDGRQVKATHTDELVRLARQIERWQRRRRVLRKEAKRIDQDIKRAKREIKALAALIGKPTKDDDDLNGSL